MKKIKLLSVVVPAYKQSATIEKNIALLTGTLEELQIPFEVVVVVDGYVDDTYKIARKIKDKRVVVYGYEENRGKGYATRLGMLKAQGDIIGFVDAGMDLDATGISLLLDTMMWNDADIVIGSKLHPDSKVNYPFYRTILSWGYRSLTHILFGLSVKDTQVGMKFFKRSLVRKVFPKLLVKAFAFDIEILAVSNAFGFSKIYECPIKLNFQDNSSITSSNFWNVIYRMLWDTAAVFYRLKILRYYNKTI